MAKLHGKSGYFLLLNEWKNFLLGIKSVFFLFFTLCAFSLWFFLIHSLFYNAGHYLAASFMSLLTYTFVYEKTTANIRNYEKRSENFLRGRLGERKILKELRKLSDNFTIFQNIEMSRGGNIDFAVLCPGALCTIEVKSHRGIISYDGQHLTHNGKPFAEKEILRQALSQAQYMRQQINHDVFEHIRIVPIVVFADSNVSLELDRSSIDGVRIVKNTDLRELLVSFSSHGSFTLNTKDELKRSILNLLCDARRLRDRKK